MKEKPKREKPKRKSVPVLPMLLVFVVAAAVFAISHPPKSPVEWLVPLLSASVIPLTKEALEQRYGKFGNDGGNGGSMCALWSGLIVFVILVVVIG